MPRNLNPYAPPMASSAPAGPVGRPGADFMREGDHLVVRKGAVLPPICIGMGTPVVGPLVHRKVHWASPWVVVLFVLVSPLIGAIVLLVIRKKGEFTFGLGEPQRKKRRVGLVLGLAAIAGSMLLFAIALGSPEPSAMALGLLGMLIGAVVAARMGQPFRVANIDNDFIHLKLQPAALAAFDRWGASTMQLPSATAPIGLPSKDAAYRQKLLADLEREF